MLSLKLFNRSVFSVCRCQSVNIHSKLQEKVSTLKNERSKQMEELKENYEPIYRFPKIGGLAAICNLKIYQGAATAIGIPIVYFTLPDIVFEFTYVGVSMLAVLSITSLIFKNSIGSVYVNKNNSEDVRIAYIDFWGRRQDSTFKINEIIPLSETPKGLSLFTKVKFTNNHADLKFINKNVLVLDNNKFSSIFGE